MVGEENGETVFESDDGYDGSAEMDEDTDGTDFDSGDGDDEGVDMGEENDEETSEPEDGVPSVVELPTESKEKYEPPSLRSASNSEPEDTSQLHWRVGGLLNRLSMSNVESITQEIAALLLAVPPNVGSQIISDEVLASCSGGPHGNEQYAAVFAAFVAGMACLVGFDFSAKILASIAKSFEFCIWDHFQELDNMELSRSMNLAKLVAEMLVNFTLSLATLKVVNLANPVEMTPERITHFRTLFETILLRWCGMSLHVLLAFQSSRC